MVYSFYKKQRILYLHRKGFRPPTIKKILEKEGLKSTRIGIYKLLERFNNTGCITRQPGSGRPSKVTEEIKKIVEEQMRQDDETTAHQLHRLLTTSKGYNLSIDTILRCRSSLGWTFRGSAYCQLIRDVNKLKRYDWAVQYKNDDFDNVIYTDETSVLFNWKPIKDSVAGNRERLLVLNQGICSLLLFLYFLYYLLL